MTTHLDEGTLLALLDGELDAPTGATARRHVAECPTCTDALDAVRADADRFHAGVQLSDRPTSVAAAHASVTRWRRHSRTGEARRALLRAAMLVLGVGGFVYASVPGLPGRAWIERSAAPDVAPAAAPASEQVVEAPKAAPAPADPAAGISILPDDGRVRVMLSGADPRVRIRVRETAGEQVEIRATGAASRARFRSGPGRVEVTGASGGDVRISLPRSARAAVIEVNGTVYMTRDGDRLRILAPLADSTAAEVVFRPSR